jgi:hypothetical protein
MGSTRWHRWMFFFPWLIYLVAGFSSSCAMLDSRKENETGLQQAAEGFNKDLRWEDYRSAMARIAPSAREVFWGVADRMHEGVRIVDFQVIDVVVDGSSGNVTLRFRFYQKQNPQIQTRTLHQQWLFSEKDRGWQLVKDDLQKLTPD